MIPLSKNVNKIGVGAKSQRRGNISNGPIRVPKQSTGSLHPTSNQPFPNRSQATSSTSKSDG